jgi:hypothetical protein
MFAWSSTRKSIKSGLKASSDMFGTLETQRHRFEGCTYQVNSSSLIPAAPMSPP